jgi:hypothetical protein
MNDQNKLYLITSVVEAGALETLPDTPSVVQIANNELLQTSFYFAEHQKVCVTSEYSLETIIDRIDPARKNAIEILKDKFKFRENLAEIYPDYKYRFVKVNDIINLKIEKKSVIKPKRGCFGTSVRIIEPDTNFEILSAELKAELIKNGKVYSDYTLSKEDFIVEQYIEGEEYAVDMFYNSTGEPCIVNLYHHPMPENEAYLHMAYNSSKAVFDKIYTKVKFFLTEINQILKVANFVMHVEVKVCNDEIFPVEINTMRFGGMGLGNLVFYSFDVNPYTCFINDCEPDWENMWKGKEKDVYTFFIAYNGAKRSMNNYKPNYGKLKQLFTNILHEQPFDYTKQLAFGIYFLKETEENITKLLKIEFDDFFEEI